MTRSVRLLANENVPKSVVEALRGAGHDTSWVRTEMPGAADIAVLAKAVAESRLLLTFDKDFGELAFRSRLPAASGIVLLRLDPTSPTELADVTIRALSRAITWAGHFSVVEDDRIRVVPLPAPASAP